jgi:Phosphodiester glycosidase
MSLDAVGLEAQPDEHLPSLGTVRGARRERILRRRRRTVGRALAAILLVGLAVVGWSVGHALTRPGNDPTGVKLVEWVRDHGGGGMVNRVEAWWYSNHQPPKGGTPKGGIPRVAAPRRSVAPTAIAPPRVLPVNIVPVVANPLPLEGVWQPAGKLVSSLPVVYQTFLRPDAVHTSLLTGVVWMDEHLLKGALYNGLQVPGGGPWQHGAQVAPQDFGALVVAFNGGFRLDASQGGYLTEGRVVTPLVAGRASLVVRRDGTVTVGSWGRDVGPGLDVASVRQNLDLLVDGGQPVPGLLRNDHHRWGATLGGAIFVWRSGVGVDRAGNLIYAAGQLDIVSLANMLARAGAVRAMELDINSGWVSFYTYTGSGPADTQGVRLLGSIQRPADRYLKAGTRDFVAMFAR